MQGAEGCNDAVIQSTNQRTSGPAGPRGEGIRCGAGAGGGGGIDATAVLDLQVSGDGCLEVLPGMRDEVDLGCSAEYKEMNGTRKNADKRR